MGFADAAKAWVVERLPDGVRPWLPFLPAAMAVGGLFGGVAWNALTLGRIDAPGTQLKLLVTLLVLGALLVVERRLHERRTGWDLLEQRGAGLVGLATLSAIGSLFNAYVVLYFKSAANLKMWLFGGLLLGAVAFARLLKERAGGEHVRLVTFLLCSFSLFLFWIPLSTGRLGGGVFALSALLALLLNGLVLLASRLHLRDVPAWVRAPREAPSPLFPTSRGEVVSHVGAWGGTLALLGLLSLVGAIPPVPLALVEAGVFHEVARGAEGYVARYEPPPWHAPWRDQDRPFHLDRGDRVTFFTALFAPSGMDFTVVHRWQYKDPERGWVDEDRLSYRVSGGREAGFRGSTRKSAVRPGKWRIIVETAEGREIGRRRFRVVEGRGRAAERERVFR